MPTRLRAPSCGRRDDRAATWTAPAAAARWGRWAVWTAFAVPFGYAATRWAWALGLRWGISAEFYEYGQSVGLWLLGAVLATMGAGGAVLTLGLAQRWGEVFPRWLPWLAGRRVPPAVAIVPASLVAVLITTAGLMYVRLVVLRGIPEDGWATVLPETMWPVWGVALGVATVAYHLRRRGPCRHCGRPVHTARSELVAV